MLLFSTKWHSCAHVNSCATACNTRGCLIQTVTVRYHRNVARSCVVVWNHRMVICVVTYQQDTLNWYIPSHLWYLAWTLACIDKAIEVTRRQLKIGCVSQLFLRIANTTFFLEFATLSTCHPHRVQLMFLSNHSADGRALRGGNMIGSLPYGKVHFYKIMKRWSYVCNFKRYHTT